LVLLFGYFAMKKPALIFLFTISCLFANAQKHELSFEAGINTFSFLKSGLNQYYKKLAGFQQGVNYQYNFKKYSSIAASVLYLKKGYRFAEEGESGVQAPYSDTKTNYLAIPVAYKFSFLKGKIRPYLQIGLMPTLLCNTVVTKFDDFDNDMSRGRTYLFTNKVWHMDVFSGIGLDYKMGNHFKADFKFTYAFTYAFIDKQATASNIFTHTAFPFPNTYMYSIGLRYLFNTQPKKSS
jgi:hypothetical protein